MNYTRNNYEAHVLDYLEGTMSEDQRDRFEHFLLANPDIYNEVSEMKLIYLTPDLSVQFPDKERLHKTGTKGGPIRMWYAIAAALIILIVFVFLLDGPQSVEPMELVDGHSTEEFDMNPDDPVENITSIESNMAEVNLGQEKVVNDVVKPIKSGPGDQEKVLDQEPSDKSFVQTDFTVENISSEEAGSKVVEAQIELAEIEGTDEIIKASQSLVTNPLPVLDQLPSADLTESLLIYEADRKEELFAITDIEVEKEKSIMGRLLANINLIPSGLRDLDKDEFREKVMPEFIASRD